MNTQSKNAAAFFTEIRNHVTKFIPVALAVIGEVIVATNAERMKTSTDCTINGKRYTVSAKFIIKEIK